MFTRQATVVAILGVILAACSVGTATTPSPQARPSPSDRPPSLATASPSPTAVATPALTPEPTPKATPAPAPPKPTGVKFLEESDCLSDSCHRAKYTQTVMWKAPRTKGVEIRVYGVTECLAEPAHARPGASGPCLVKNTLVPPSVRTLLAKAPASDGWVSWSWKQETGCEIGPFSSRPDGPSYFAIVIAAYNTSDHSVFAIAEPGGWYEPEEGDTFC